MKATSNLCRSIFRDQKGQNLVEFALVLPLLLLLVIGIAEFGRAWMTQNILTGAAREAARLAAVAPPGGSVALAEARGNSILATAGIAATVKVNDPGVSYGTVTARVDFVFPVLIVGFIPGLNNITLSSETSMRREF